ncbi:MAG TPA: GAF domain-containing protein [Anaerolineaceae bacterium]|nr:GAF domain-containing protein [Anaerolineaceae bacterium]
MAFGDLLGIGIILMVFGVGFWALARYLLSNIAKTMSSPVPAGARLEISQGEKNPEAILVVQQGGKIVSITPRARQAFQLDPNEMPNLERMARKVRPTEQFLGLCAAEGQARLVLSGRMVDAVSYRLNSGQVPWLVVTLRFPEMASDLEGGAKGLNSETLQIFSELSQVIAGSLDFDATLLAIQQSIEKLVPTDFLEITVWEAASDSLVPYRFVGLPGAERKLELSRERYALGQGYSGYIAQNRVPLVVGNIDARSDLVPAIDRDAFPLRSFIGVPLLVDKDLVGTLELGSLDVDTYQQDDLNLLNLLAGQAAVALRNATRYRAEQRRTAELAGLAQLAQSFSAVRDPKTIFARLVEAIKPLIPVEILGFLIYNETTRMLEGQEPMQGLPPQIVALYRAPILPDSAAEQTLLNQDVIITEHASDSPEWESLGLSFLAQAASLRDTVLIPLASGGRMLGYLQASNHRDGSTVFSQEELRLLMIVSNQAAPIIENATLILQSRQRAQRAEGLRRIASLASSAATLDEILKYSLNELGQLLQAGVGAIFLVDASRNALQLHRSSFYGVEPDESADFTIFLEDPQFPFTVTGSQRTFVSGNLLEEKAIIPYYQRTLNELKIVSAVAVPLVIRNDGIGEIWFGSTEVNSFDQGELQLVVTAAGQLAGVVEQSTLRAQTDESLRRRIEQLTALSRISRELSTSVDLTNLLQLVYSEALLATRADCGTILLFETEASQDQPEAVRFYVGDEPGSSLDEPLKNVLSTGQILNVPDTGLLQLELPHEEISSLLAVPILYQQHPAGLIVLHSHLQGCFDKDSEDVALSLADQAAVALGNALQYEEQLARSALLKRELDTLGKLFQVAPLLRPDQSLEDVLRAIAGAIQSVTPFQAVVISQYEESTELLRRVVGAGLTPEAWKELRSHSQPWKSIQQLLLPEYRIGNSYYIPADKTPVVPEDVHTITVLPSLGVHEVDAWDADDFLLVPLYDSKGRPLGLLSLDAPNDGCRPDRPTFEALDLFAAQASLIIESRQRLRGLELQLRETETRLGRMTQSVESAQKHLPSLLHHDLETALIIQGMHKQMDRAHSGLEMAELANRQTDSFGMLRVLAQELIVRFNLQLALIAEKDPAGVRLVEVVGNPPASTNIEALFGQRNPLRQLVQDRKLALAANIDSDKTWQNNPFLTALGAKCFIGLPVHISESHQIGVLAIGANVLPPFQEEDDQVFGQLSRQVSVGAQNLELLKETQRRLREVNLLLEFTRKIDVLDPGGILRTLVENALQALPSANAGWVALWRENERALVPQIAAGYSDNNSLSGIRFLETTGENHPLPLRVFFKAVPQRQEVSFAKDYNLPSSDLLLYRQATGGRLPVSSMIIPLKRGAHTLGVLVLDNFNTSDAFSSEDEALANSLAQQTALALESARLFTAADRRASQLHALTQVAGTITSSLQRSQLITSLLDLFRAVLPFNTATLWLREDDKLKIYSANGFTDDESRIGLTVSIQDSDLFKAMMQKSQPICVPDIRKDERFVSQVEPENISWLGVPLVAKGELVGVIALEKREADFYTSEHIQAATTFASQAAIALENARLFEESTRRASELNERSLRLALLNRLSTELSGTLDVDRILTITSQQLLEALKGKRVAAVLIGDTGEYTLQIEFPLGPDSLPRAWPAVSLFSRLSESQGIFSCADVENEPEVAGLLDLYLTARKVKSFAVVPLVTAVKLYGWLVVQKSEVYRFTPSELELARTIANQSAIAFQTAYLYQETLHLTEDLEHRVEERTSELRREHNNTETLLHIITELSNSLDMNQVLNRALAVLNSSIGSQQSILYLPQAKRIYQVGESLATNGDEGISEIGQEIARWVIRRRMPALVEDLENETRWKLPKERPLAFRSMIAVPLVLGEEILGAMLLVNKEPASFISEQVGLVEATARQFSITLNNAELFTLIRDQAENLGGILRNQQMEASRSRAILEAVADGVLVTNSTNHITLCNSSAERILNIEAANVVMQPLDHFSGLFGETSQAWLQTILKWSNDPSSYQGETFSERLELDNGSILAVNLAPVFFRNEFMATVSIFRDITHEVQVDRMKSEFIANVSHELRTPMTSIKGYVEVMLMGVTGKLSEQQEHFLKIIKNNTERLNLLVNDLLDVSRIESGRLKLDLQPVNIQDVASEILAEFQRRSREEERSISLNLDCPKDIPPVKADAGRLRQIISSLVSNGYNYTPNNGHVLVRVRPVEEEVQIDIQDDGIGIDPKYQGRIFERFYRGEDPLVLQTAGTGLGLAIARILVDMHAGRIWFTSSGVKGEGSVFSFTIPVFKPEE